MDVITILSEYRTMFLVAFIFILFIIWIVLMGEIVKKIKVIYENKKNNISKVDLEEIDFEKLKKHEQTTLLRRMISADAVVNPNADDYMILYDKVKKVYVRSITVSIMSQRVNFANTFADLMNFPDSTNSIIVEPLSDISTSKKLDHHLVVLESEFIATDDSNRRRKLQSMYTETNEWAKQIETGKNKFFRVGFVFALYADSLEALNKRSDSFRHKARSKGLDVSTCVAVQPEAYLANMPFNSYVSGKFPTEATDGIFYHYMDKYAVATIFNYTSCSFSHRDGVLLGRDRITKRPFIYNPYHQSFNGYTFLAVGKTGTGKSALIKMLCYRCSLQGYRFASLDVQPRQGTNDGEYSGICTLLGGINFELKNGGSNKLNIFEVRETSKYIKTGIGRGYEKRTLDLNSSIAQIANLIRIMICENSQNNTLQENITMNRIIKDTIKKTYDLFGIVDGDPDSLYDKGMTLKNGVLTQDKVLKELPTISDFFKILLQDQQHETDEDMKKMRKLILMAMEEYVSDLYYTPSLRFFSEKEYLELPVKPGTNIRMYVAAEGFHEEVKHIHGTRGYFDGQSTLHYSEDIIWVNIDCSQLDEESKKVAMSVGQNYINERIIKGNSENRSSAQKIIVIFDEAHMIFKILAARALLAEIVRTVRKRHVALGICTQTLRELDEFEETKAIRVNAAAQFIFKQDYSEKQYLIKTLGLTEKQVEDILEQGGNIDQANSGGHDEELEAEKKKHLGECTLVINKTAIPLKIDYLKRTEKHAVETAASEIIEILDQKPA